jgi:predicted enzyme related to lactoylglutathione lyase
MQRTPGWTNGLAGEALGLLTLTWSRVSPTRIIEGTIERFRSPPFSSDADRVRCGCRACRLGRKGGSMKLNSVLIGSEDPDSLTAYYTKLFGEPTWNEGGYTGWQIGDGGVTVGPHDQVKGKNAQPGRVIWNIETPDVKGDFDRLRNAGGTVVREPYRPAEEAEMWIATFADPDGNYFQLVSPM